MIMPNQELIIYIQKKLEKNSSEKEIKEILLNHGWKEELINEAFDSLSVSKEEQLHQDFYQSFSKPVAAEKIIPKKKPSKKRLIIFVFIFLFIILSSIAFAYYYTKEPLIVLSKAMEKTLEIKSIETKNDFKIIIDDQLLEELNKEIEFKIEKEYALSSQISFDYKNLEDIKASFSLANENINTEFVLINNNLYGKLNYFNFDLSSYGFSETTIQSIINNWVKAESYSLKDLVFENELRHKKIIELIKDRPELVKKIERLSGNGDNHHYKIEIDKQELGNIIINSFYQEELTGEEIIQIKDFINQDLNINNFEIWIGKKDNLIYKLLIDIRINKLQINSKEGGINVYYTTDISNHNKPISISEPQSFITPEELMFYLFEPPQDIDIKNYMKQLNLIAEAYKTQNNQYASKIINNNACNKYLAKTFLEDTTGGYELCEKIQMNSSGILIIKMNNLTGDNAKYCIQKTLNSGYAWCIDSTGYSNYGKNCDNINFNCKNP